MGGNGPIVQTGPIEDTLKMNEFSRNCRPLFTVKGETVNLGSAHAMRVPTCAKCASICAQAAWLHTAMHGSIT